MTERRDPGLAPERTSLAWTRSSLGLLALAALMLRFARREEVPFVGESVVVASVLTAAGAALYGWRERLGAPRAIPAVGALRALAAATVVIAVGSAATVLVALG